MMGILKKLIGNRSDWIALYKEILDFETTLPDVSRVIVLAAHHDDESLGCGGTIALHKRARAEVQVVVFTDGRGVSYKGTGDVGILRQQEAERAGEVLGVDTWHFLDLPDGRLHKHKRQGILALKEIVKQFRPDLVYVPSPVDFHPDHRAVFEISIEFLKCGVSRFAFYEIYSPIRFNLLIDVTDVMALKLKALSLYEVSLMGSARHYIGAIKGLNTYRRLLTNAVEEEKKYYEAFWHIDKPLSKQDMVKWLTYSL